MAFELLTENGDEGRASDVAKTLQRRFRYVLVDECQDLNPIQQAVLKLVSRSTESGHSGNLFMVGDIKQSIYRFRLAEPRLFAERVAKAKASKGGDQLILLQTNFRSRREILESVNLVFRQLMRTGVSDVFYDADAELRPPVEREKSTTVEPVELHVLGRGGPVEEVEDADPDEFVEPEWIEADGASRWTAIEREAFWIGSRIGKWIAGKEPSPIGGPIQYRDIVVLLRVARNNAEQVAAVLGRLGVPAFADVGGALFEQVESRDVLSALELLDNFRQDIPLAAVLRSGIFGDTFTPDELARVRWLDRSVAFHEVVLRYGQDGSDKELRERISAFLLRIERYRRMAQRRPLSVVLAEILESEGYLAFATAQPRGAMRRANLLKLQELTQKFGSFRRQGLHRFLRFVQTLRERQESIVAASPLGEGEDVVRVLSIHQAKGLEFPVVFLAGLGTRFNLGDRSGRIIVERRNKIGLRVVDVERKLEYPSAAHHSAAIEIERTTRDEEMRILYVGMTRAKHKLVLVGSMNGAGTCHGLARANAGKDGPSTLRLSTARCALDWMLSALESAPKQAVAWAGSDSMGQATVSVTVHDSLEIGTWRLGNEKVVADRILPVLARLEPLPREESREPGDAYVERVMAQLAFVYPHLSAGSVRAVIAASEFKGTFDYFKNPEQQDTDVMAESVAPGQRMGMNREASLRRGVATHRFLQHVSFEEARDTTGLERELQRMVGEGVLGEEDIARFDRSGVEWFLSTPLGDRVRAAGEAYRRELKFVTTEPAGYFDSTQAHLQEDFILVRGMVDGILPDDGVVELIDFKTDALGGEDVPGRVDRYRPQMELYARAVARLWRRPVRTAWLVFLAPKIVVPCGFDSAERDS